MPEFMHYQVLYKNRAWGHAITEGFRAKVASPGQARLGRGYTHIIAGLQFGALDTLKAVRAAGEPYIFIDRAYFGGGSKSGRMRITFGAYQQHWIAPDRGPRDWGVTLKPWRNGGDFLMVVPPSSSVQSVFGIDWTRFLPNLGRSGLRVVVSPKSDRDVSPIEERLQGCAGVITWSSNVAVDAVREGVPAWTSEESAAAPVAGRLDGDVIGREIHGDREAWLRSLSWAQFTVDEVRSGFARDVVMAGVEEHV